ncbi:hypothetical protein ACLEQD_32970, partial [Corallococcus sp. 4LFB]
MRKARGAGILAGSYERAGQGVVAAAGQRGGAGGPGLPGALLDPRELLRALESTPMALPCLPVLAKGALPGLLGA